MTSKLFSNLYSLGHTPWGPFFLLKANATLGGACQNSEVTVVEQPRIHCQVAPVIYCSYWLAVETEVLDVQS